MSERNPGRVRERLAPLLLKDLGIIADPEDLWTQEGFYRNNKHDLARWGANGCRFEPETAKRLGFTHSFNVSSWDTMTECCQMVMAFVSDPNEERACLEISVTTLRPRRKA